MIISFEKHNWLKEDDRFSQTLCFESFDISTGTNNILAV